MTMPTWVNSIPFHVWHKIIARNINGRKILMIGGIQFGAFTFIPIYLTPYLHVLYGRNLVIFENNQICQYFPLYIQYMERLYITGYTLYVMEGSSRLYNMCMERTYNYSRLYATLYIDSTLGHPDNGPWSMYSVTGSQPCCINIISGRAGDQLHIHPVMELARLQHAWLSMYNIITELATQNNNDNYCFYYYCFYDQKWQSELWGHMQTHGHSAEVYGYVKHLAIIDIVATYLQEHY